MQTMTSLEREAWGIFFKVFQAMRTGYMEGKTPDARREACLSLSGKYDLGRSDKIKGTVTLDGASLAWVYQEHTIASLEYRWAEKFPVLVLASGGQYTEATRTRLCAALKITNGWTIHARKEGQRRQWYLTSDYLPFPTTKEKLAEYKEKQYIKTFSEGMTIPISF